jgi:hypothetical protein
MSSFTPVAASVALLILLLPDASRGERVAVKHTEGSAHGFLVLRTLDGSAIADGDLVQTTHGSRVTKRMVFRFKDGSAFDETAIFTEEKTFRLLTYRTTQKGPSFPHTLDMSIDVSSQRVTVRYTDDDGETKLVDERLDLPPDLANGLVAVLLKNVDRSATPQSLPIVAATPKPRLIKLEVAAVGEESFSTGLVARKATHYVLKPVIGGVAGLVAPLVGKNPPVSHVWILGGLSPAFVKSEQPLAAGGPVWRIEAVSPVWPRAVAQKR